MLKQQGEKGADSDWEGLSDESFSCFLEKQGFDGKLKKYITDTIGVLQTDTTARAGLKAVYQFLESLGRYGNSPFLWTLYGSGELSQGYCRLCAVFGGVYCLNRSVDGLVIAEERVIAVITGGQRIGCQYLITDASYLPQQYANYANGRKILRTSLISERSILQDPEKDHISLLNLNYLDTKLSPWLLEVGYEGCVAPKNFCEGPLLSNF
ncbi:unnamed protein product [Enterobius vermicularis]|uniref:DUF899 domain-containing protein n=1 Tax=Enterobius vermicularis TaxID=51028 RepID=A0A0N4VHL7_ENTVE|nr:unnamed protein product [Enterobius vermicularis]